MQKLKLNGKSLKICSLTSRKKAVLSHIISGPEVSNCNGERYQNLPNVFDQKTMLVNNTEFLRTIFNVVHIHIPELTAEAKLLIATNNATTSHFFKKEMERNEKFHQEYTKFLDDVISNGFAKMSRTLLKIMYSTYRIRVPTTQRKVTSHFDQI